MVVAIAIRWPTLEPAHFQPKCRPGGKNGRSLLAAAKEARAKTAILFRLGAGFALPPPVTNLRRRWFYP